MAQATQGEALVSALIFLFIAAVIATFAGTIVYLIGWHEERQYRARIARRLAEINRDSSQRGGA
jgi:hypothetical protein